MLGAAWKRWNWLDDGLIPLAGIAMTAAWVYPLFTVFLRDPSTGAGNPGFTFLLSVLILLGGLVAGRLASQNRMGTVIVIVGGLATILVSLLLTVPSEGQAIDLWLAGLFKFSDRGRETGEVLPVPLVMIVCTAILWARGVRLAGIQHDSAVGSFIAGVVAIAGLLLVASVLPSVQSPQGSSRVWSNFLAGLAPLFLVSIPAAVLFTLMAPALGTWASTAGDVSIVVGILFLNLIMPYGPVVQTLVGWLLLFLASGLATLALVSVSTTLHEQQRLTGIHLRTDRYWVMIMLVVVAAVLLLGLILSQIIVPGALLRLLSLLRPIWVVVRQVLLYIILFFAYLFFSLVEPLLAEMQGRPARPREEMYSPVAPDNLEEIAGQPAEISPAFVVMLQVLLVLALLAIIAYVFYIAIQKREKRVLEEDEVEETRESVLSMALIQEQLRGLLDGLRRRPKELLFADLGLPGDPRRRVREMYQHVLARAIQLNTPRMKHQTPKTYSSALASLCPAERSAVDVLTQVYMVARYGTEPPTLEQVHAAQEAYARIDAILQRDYAISQKGTKRPGTSVPEEHDVQ